MSKVRPRLVFADAQGRIFDHPYLQMLCRRGTELATPRPDELTVLPEESELFLLPGRSAVGLDPETGQAEAMEENAVAAFVAPGYTLAASTAYMRQDKAPVLPLFAYGAVGFADGKFYVAAKKVDESKRQVFANVNPKRIQQGAQAWLKRRPDNRLVQHLMGCALTNCCPAARNLCLGRYEAPLPTAQRCNARCLGCISLQPESSGFPATQKRIDFTPSVQEITEIMHDHARKERQPIFSFGQGCEGEPLTEAERIAEAVAAFREAGGRGTVNVNTNASLPLAMPELARAGVNSVRVSMNSASAELYAAYYRPAGYAFSDVVASIAAAKAHDMFVSLNFLYFPGVSDTEEEFAALVDLVQAHHVNFIQMRNLNLDPELYVQLAPALAKAPSMGLKNFLKRLRKSCAWIENGYFNPYVES